MLNSYDFLNNLLSTVNGNKEKRVYIIRTVDEFLKKESMLGRIKLLSERIRKQTVGETIVFFVASNLELSPIIEKDIFLNTSIGYPDEKIINQIIEKVFEKEATDELVSKCKGLTRFEIERVLNLAKVKSEESTTETDKDALLKLVLKEKDQIIRKSGLVELVDTGDAIEPAGLKELMDWIDIKTKIFNNPVKAAENHVDLPRGVMLVGMPGCGKSSIAKATAKKFNVPLLKIDMGSLMNKYLGESEHNFKDALKLAEAMSPCVVWVDEMEKAFHSGDDKESSSDSAGRILAYLLTWMQERKSMTFVIATANEVKKLPPELLRKGRFDEVFFLDFPSEKERAEILKLHLDRRGISFSGIFDVAYKTHDYSGAEIEYVVRDVTEKRFLNILDGKSECVTKKMFEEVIKNTTPLSETMKDELEELREFCKKRKFRRANSEK